MGILWQYPITDASNISKPTRSGKDKPKESSEKVNPQTQDMKIKALVTYLPSFHRSSRPCLPELSEKEVSSTGGGSPRGRIADLEKEVQEHKIIEEKNVRAVYKANQIRDKMKEEEAGCNELEVTNQDLSKKLKGKNMYFESTWGKEISILRDETRSESFMTNKNSTRLKRDLSKAKQF
ncbi:predicted protein [Arabidopsis lyrata subsp. lyrata]|uniref:Predicted protein n=1 Tax=Arabidopsis lyrata subsp. lyrata TaxID=81972 RepID=D7MPT6_ARALL|nr:predicted protein [Arabidopsis lyrata subsp. lyrata]